MSEFSFLIGGKAGDGIDKAGFVLGRALARLGYNIYIYRDYPSLIRGGHTFSIIRASTEKIASHSNQVDIIFALNQDTVNFHQQRLKNKNYIVFDADTVKAEGSGLALEKIVKEENAPSLMRNSCMLGAFAKTVGISWEVLEEVLKKEIPRELELNLKVAKRGYDAAGELLKIQPLTQKELPLISGNEAIGLGLVKGGLKNYVAYPMTPSSGILHFLAGIAEKSSLKVIHPESEIAVILMALGFAYCGEKTAIGTSGGGFCLMTESLSLAAMAELPLVVILGQRPGPSTGLPTYSSQTELHFAINSGHGEFPRFIIAPGDAEEAHFSSVLALNIAWKYQIPAFILCDKTINEGTYSFEFDRQADLPEENPLIWDRQGEYKRYQDAENGVSPLAFAGDKGAIIKVNSYEHDEAGITAEGQEITVRMQDKRLRKEKYLLEDLARYNPVRVYGDNEADTALLCWGSNKGVCFELAKKFSLKMIQPLILWPFPLSQFQSALKGVEKLICVENNATGQLIRLIKNYGIEVNTGILKYDGRPFSLDELELKLKEIL